MNIEGAIGVIQAKTGKTREEIAGMLGRNPSYLSTVKKKPTQKIVDLLNEKFKKELEDFDWNEKPIIFNDALGVTIENQIEILATGRTILSILAELQAPLKKGFLPTQLANTYRKMVKDEAELIRNELRRKS